MPFCQTGPRTLQLAIYVWHSHTCRRLSASACPAAVGVRDGIGGTLQRKTWEECSPQTHFSDCRAPPARHAALATRVPLKVGNVESILWCDFHKKKAKKLSALTYLSNARRLPLVLACLLPCMQ